MRVIVFAFAIAAAGCQREAESPDAYAAKTAVSRYNQTLVEAFRSGDQERLAPVAAEAERHRVGAIIAGLMKRGQLMAARQLEQRVESVRRIEADLFEVRTKERWTYEHRRLEARDTPADQKEATYRMVYQVRRERDAWLVQHAATIEEPRPEGTR